MQSMSPKSSPLWKKPSDILKFRLLKTRKRNLQRRLCYEDSRESASSFQGTVPDDKVTASRGSGHRKNPFGKESQSKRRRSDHHCPSAPSQVGFSELSCDSTLFQLLEVTGQLSADTDAQNATPLETNKTKANAFNPSTSDDAATAAADKRQSLQTQLPFDWSLKTAIRITSDQPFLLNAGRLTTSEEASGVTGYVRCLPLSKESKCFALDTSTNAQLFQCCQVWMHPSLPWLKLFPRHQSRAASLPANDVRLQAQISNTLHSDWTESFRSLFHLLRARQCPYFYVCAQSFTVLFRAAGVAGNPRIHALMAPTTRGLRLALTEEGVRFTLPLLQEQDKLEDLKGQDEAEICKSTEEEDPCEQDLEVWLKTAGVEDTMVAQIGRDRASVNKQKEIDYRAESLVYAEDNDVHALFNFLLNSKSCTATSGPMAGIPPTLLAPVAFTGATLRSLKTRQQQARHDSKLVHVFDMTGPILPHTVHYLNNLLRTRVQGSHFDIMLSTLEPTVPFCTYSPSKIDEAAFVFGRQSLSDCGLSPEVIEGMCMQKRGVLLRTVSVSPDGYLCRS